MSEVSIPSYKANGGFEAVWDSKGSVSYTLNGEKVSKSEVPADVIAAALEHGHRFGESQDAKKDGSEKDKKDQDMFCYHNGQIFEADGKTPLSEERRKKLEVKFGRPLEEIVKDSLEGQKIDGGKGADMIKYPPHDKIKSANDLRHAYPKRSAQHSQTYDRTGNAVEDITRFVDKSMNKFSGYFQKVKGMLNGHKEEVAPVRATPQSNRGMAKPERGGR